MYQASNIWVELEKTTNSREIGGINKKMPCFAAMGKATSPMALLVYPRRLVDSTRLCPPRTALDWSVWSLQSRRPHEKDTRCHLERYEQKNEEKEKRKIENLNVRPILRWFFWVDFLFSDRFLPDGFTVEQRPTESPPKGRLRNPRKVVPMSVTVHVPSQTSSIMGENYGNFFISWWKSKPVKFHWQKRSSSTEDFSPVPKLVINFSQLPNMSFVDEFHHFYTSFHDIFHRMVDNPQHRNLPCA